MSTNELTQLLLSAQNTIEASVLVGGLLIGQNENALRYCISRGVKVRFLFPSLNSEWLKNYLDATYIPLDEYKTKIAINADAVRSMGADVKFHNASVFSWFVIVDRVVAASKPISFFKEVSPTISHSDEDVQGFIKLFDLLWTRPSPNMQAQVSYPHTGELKLPDNERQRKVLPGQLQIFLCHSSKDKPKIRLMYQQLINDGFRPWLDEKDLLPGQDWNLEIVNALRSSDVVILFLSNESVSKTGYLQKELKTAIDIAQERPQGSIFLIPAKLEECDVPYGISNLHYVNLFAPDGYENLLRSLRARQGQQEMR